MNPLLRGLLLAALLAPAAASARDEALLGAWVLDNKATLEGIAQSRRKTDEQTAALDRLYKGTTTCAFTESTWECKAARNPHSSDWTRRGSYRLLRGDGVYRVVEFKVTQQGPQPDPSPVQHGVSLIKVTSDGYAIFRPDLDYWQYLKRAK